MHEISNIFCRLRIRNNVRIFPIPRRSAAAGSLREMACFESSEDCQPREGHGPGVGTRSLGWLVDFRAQIPWVGASADGSENGWVGVQNLKFSGYITVSGLCMHDFGARASAPWKIFCCLLKFLLNNCYKCMVGSKNLNPGGLVG